MYEDTVGCNFDQNSMPESAESVLNLNPLPLSPPPQVLMPSLLETHNNNNNSFAVVENLRLSMEELSYPHQQDHHAAMEIELQNELGFNPYSTNTDHLVSFEQQTNWDNIHGVHDQMQQQLQDGANGAYPHTPDLLNLFSLPRCSPSSVLQNSSITFTNPNPKSSNFLNSLGFLGDVHGGIDHPTGIASSVLYDPLFHLNLPPQPPLFRELLQSLPYGYSLPGSRNGSLFTSGGDEGEGIGGGVYSDVINNGKQFENGVLEFSREMGSIGRGGDVKGTKHFATNKIRRQQIYLKATYLPNAISIYLGSNGSTVLNLGIAQYARSVRGSNIIRIEIRDFLRARDNTRITLGLNVVSTRLPTRRCTCRQCVSNPSDKASPENLRIMAQNSYPR
ncbi:transcription factor bHLH10-like [Prunus dulcis]|uniref:transcription factor bHLH10-like n=1 Tax=Prunus dulcis TaxID=3755 RepID=UPI0014829981|nr:transcription factor bHLH10-like [Prunus dulcis]